MRALLVSRYKSVISVFLAAALVVGGLGAMLLSPSRAITVDTGAVGAVAPDFVEDFESGTVGSAVPDWTKTAMETNLTKTDPSNTSRVNTFLSNNALTIAEENGNKVASVAKTGAGYIGVTSAKIPVDAGATYDFSVDYMTASPTGVDGTENRAKYNGVGIVIGEVNTEGVETLKSVNIDYTFHNTWETFKTEYTVKVDTENVIIYLWSGSAYNYNITTYFDNVSLTRDRAIVVDNGDFEQGKVGADVPDWTKVAIDNNSKKKIDQPAYLAAYSATTADDNGDRVLSVKKTGAGYIGVASKPVSVAAGCEYVITFDYILKEYSVKSGMTPGDNGTLYKGTALLVEEFDSDGNSLSTDSKLATIYSDHIDATQADTGWKSAKVSYTPSASASSVVFYFYSGGLWNMYSTVCFDDLEICALKDYRVVYNNTFDKVTYNADGGRANGVAGPNGWTLYTASNTGANTSGEYNKNYVASVVEENGNKFVKLEGNNGVTKGYASLMSPYIAVNAGESFSASFDYKIEGTKDDNDYGSYINFYYFDKDKNYISHYHPAGLDYTKCGQGWQTKYEDHSDMKVPANAAYMTVGFWTGGRWNYTQNIDYYFDNICITFDGELDYWTEETCRESATPYDYPDYKDNYDIRKISDSKDHPEALQLYVSRAAGTGGGVVFYSEAIPVTGGTDYTTAFDSKIENSVAWSNSTNLYGASYVVRWLKADGSLISRQDLTGRRFDNMDWTRYEYDITAPADAASVQIGLVIGSYSWGICKDLEYSYDNIVFMESDAYDAATGDPNIVNSPLYKKNALFIGDAIGNALAEEAKSYSKMAVTDICGDTAIKEQLAALTDTAYDYVVISVGDAEIKANMPVGQLTANTVYMNTQGFDTDTFAGLLEQTFADVTEYLEPKHIVYVLPTTDAGYKTIAAAAAAKWGVALAVISDTADQDKSWKETVTPAESAPDFDSFAVLGLADYLAEKAEDISKKGLSFEEREILDAIIVKAEKCPENHSDQDKFDDVVTAAKAVIAEYDDYAPLMLGATIAENDPNLLQFIAAAPKKQISNSIEILKMGILIMANDDLGKQGAELVIGNEFTKNIVSEYTSPLTAFYGDLKMEEVDPFAEYVAVSYIVYKENGKEYTFYSQNDYKNSFGDVTATDGKCVKSVTGIAKDIAMKLVAEKESLMDFTAIGGKANKNVIVSATDTATLKSIYHLVQDNADLIASILG